VVSSFARLLAAVKTGGKTGPPPLFFVALNREKGRKGIYEEGEGGMMSAFECFQEEGGAILDSRCMAERKKTRGDYLAIIV